MQRLPIRSYAAAAFFVGYLLVQLWVPLTRLPLERPSKFGWQMFSDLRTALPRVELVFSDHTQPVPAHEIVIYHRIDISYGPHLAGYYCERTSAEAVITRYFRPPREVAYRCGLDLP